jgi:hypothetical protein
MSFLAAVVADQVHGHVVGGPERRRQLVRPGRGERGDPLEIDPVLLIDHDRVAQFVDATTAGPPGQLRVLAGGQQLVPLSLELEQILDDDGLRRHVDAERERLRGEDQLDEPALEELLHRLLVQGEHPSVM